MKQWPTFVPSWLRRQPALSSVALPTPSAVVPERMVVDRADTMAYRREWVCACGAGLRLRSRTNRADGPSNFLPFPEGHRLAGHSQIPSERLTWNGMAEERGWGVDPTTCPACQRGLSLADYKRLRRELVTLEAAYAVLIRSGLSPLSESLARQIAAITRQLGP